MKSKTQSVVAKAVTRWLNIPVCLGIKVFRDVGGLFLFSKCWLLAYNFPKCRLLLLLYFARFVTRWGISTPFDQAEPKVNHLKQVSESLRVHTFWKVHLLIFFNLFVKACQTSCLSPRGHCLCMKLHLCEGLFSD
jgi:hypothetical protein